jgi:hypothetical protein
MVITNDNSFLMQSMRDVDPGGDTDLLNGHDVGEEEFSWQ